MLEDFWILSPSESGVLEKLGHILVLVHLDLIYPIVHSIEILVLAKESCELLLKL